MTSHDETGYGDAAVKLNTADGTHQQRHISLLTRKTVALVLAGGRGSRLHELTLWRAKPAVHFGGKFHIVDFALSNAINSGIRRVGVLTQYKAHSLVRHLRDGWCGFKRALGEFVDVLPASESMPAGIVVPQTRFIRTSISFAILIPSMYLFCREIIFTKWTTVPCLRSTRRWALT